MLCALKIVRIKFAPYQEKYVKEGETFEDVGKAWLKVHLLLREDKNAQNIS